MLRTLRRLLPLSLVLLLPALPSPARACPFCSMQGQTLAGEVAGADMVLFGSLANPNAKDETTDLVLEAVVKKNDALDKMTKTVGGSKAVTLPKYLDPATVGQAKFLVFCYVFKGKLDPYRGMAMTPDCVAYLQGVQDVKDKKPGERLKFFFNYLDSADPEIAMDAFKEFANAPYGDYKDMAKDLPADKIAGWLKDASTPGFRIGLYGSLLGHCGKEDDAKLLRSLVEDPARKLSSGVDGVLAGYVMIDPKEGWKYVKGMMKDPGKEFLMRYAALRTARFLHDYRPELVKPEELAEGVAQLLDQKDIADLAVEDLRKWGCSDMTDRVLGLQSTEAYKTLPIVRRSVLRFTLTFPNVPAAAAYIDEQRKTNPQGVSEAEEILKLEQGSK
jgi:hypothetical protein